MWTLEYRLHRRKHFEECVQLESRTNISVNQARLPGNTVTSLLHFEIPGRTYTSQKFRRRFGIVVIEHVIEDSPK